MAQRRFGLPITELPDMLAAVAGYAEKCAYQIDLPKHKIIDRLNGVYGNDIVRILHILAISKYFAKKCRVVLFNGQCQDDDFPVMVRYAGARLRVTIKIPATAEPIPNAHRITNLCAQNCDATAFYTANLPKWAGATSNGCARRMF